MSYQERVRDSPFDYFSESTEAIAAIFLTVFFLSTIFVLRNYFKTWFTTLFWSTVVIVPFLSNFYHLFYGEGSMKDYGGDGDLLDVFSSSTWENFGFIREDGGLGIGGPLWNTYEVTMPLLVFSIYIVGAFYMIMRNGLDNFRTQTVRSPFYLSLVFGAVWGIVVYGFIADASDNVEMYYWDLASTIASMVIFILFWNEKDTL